VKANAQKTPSFIEPVKALRVDKLLEGDWLYEIKFDGYRALAFKDGFTQQQGVQLPSTARCPEIIAG
jgi:ATP-dependent DNA ligase